MRLTRRRLTVTYWPAWDDRPILGLHHAPDPHCTDCDGSGYAFGYDMDGADETECACTPYEPIAKLPLPRIVNSYYRRRLLQRLRAATHPGWSPR